MRMLIYGSGQLAAGAVRDLAEANPDNQITVLGKNRGELERLSAYPGVSVVLLTEPVMQNYRLDAGIDHVNAFLALSDNDHENLMLAQIARYMFNVRHVVCHVENPQLQIMYTAMGLNVIGYTTGILQDIRQGISAG